MGTHWAKCEVHKVVTPLGITRGSNLNLRWGKCGIWLVSWWIPFLCVFLWLSVHCTLRVWCDDFLCLTTIFIWDINMLMTLIDSLCCLSILILLLYDYSAHLDMYILFVAYLIHLDMIDSLSCILSWLSWSMLSLLDIHHDYHISCLACV